MPAGKPWRAYSYEDAMLSKSNPLMHFSSRKANDTPARYRQHHYIKGANGEPEAKRPRVE